MIIKVFEDDDSIKHIIHNKLVTTLSELGIKDITIKIVEDGYWHTYAEKTENDVEYWLIDFHYNKIITPDLVRWFQLVTSEFIKLKKYSLVDINFNKLGFAVAIKAHTLKINYSFLTDGFGPEERKNSPIFGEITSGLKMAFINKTNFLSDNMGGNDDRKEFISYLNDLETSKSVIDFYAEEWRLLRGAGIPLKSKLGGLDEFKNNKDIGFDPHHLNGGSDRENNQSSYTLDNKSIILQNIPATVEIQQKLKAKYYFSDHSLEGAITYWKRPPLRTLYQDDNKSLDFEKTIGYSLNEFSPKVKVGNIKGEIINQKTLISEDDIKRLRASHNHPFLLYFNKRKNSTEHMLHLWFNLPGVLHTLIADVGLSEQNLGWLNNDDYREAKVLFLLVGGKQGINFTTITNLIKTLSDGFTTMLFIDSDINDTGKFGINEASSNMCKCLFHHGAEWIIYINTDLYGNYYSTYIIPQKKGDFYRCRKPFDWSKKDTKPPTLSFNIKAGPISSDFRPSLMVPLVECPNYGLRLTDVMINAQNHLNYILNLQ